MPRRKSKKKVLTKLNAWKAEQENKKTGDEQGIAGQEKAEEHQVEGARERLADEQDCEVTGEWQGEEFMFNPFTANDQLQLAGQLNLSIEQYINIEQRNVPLETPVNLIRMEGDGNCFYRAVSFHIFGTQEYHAVLRQRMIEYMSTMSEDLCSLLLEPDQTMEKFLSGECHPEGPPAKLGTWATQVEIDAMSLLLGRCIFVYGKYGDNWAWMKYPIRESTCDSTMLDDSNALYIQNTNLDHFDVVTTVLRRRQTRSMSRCHREEATEVSQVPSSNSKHTLIDNDDDEDRKRARRDQERKRYREDPQYARAQREQKRTKYHTDDEHAEQKRDHERDKYHTVDEHAQQKRDHEREKYHTDPNHRDLKNRNRQINRGKNQSLADVNKDIEEFQRECKNGPEYVCTVCHRLLFCNQVVICDKDKYVEAVKHCLTGTYVHQCNVECSPHACPTANSSRGQEWICHCCHEHLSKKKDNSIRGPE
ncbi:uncharacterized protein LOC118425183 [Branchiostoma floridae]|uniref:Uncharacterized protein LOC118425183 n=1 Tax=Branchiostoma floridae TaxID=7739 RepID=A0A9J7LY45_BRAFL|nr:uncharacterized protein LOC118425183 [Branchiostoma floridae]XP_035689910.1 uncharacterized protein LOC118425183 [Branchiostoma floridae]